MIPLELLPHEGGSRVKRDRLELLTALIAAPGFDPLFRADVIDIPGGHPVYGWHCTVPDCRRVRAGTFRLCQTHRRQWHTARKSGMSRAAFQRTARPLRGRGAGTVGRCCICPDRPAYSQDSELCARHHLRWRDLLEKTGDAPDYERWVAGQPSYDGYGTCKAAICPYPAESPIGLCSAHLSRHALQGSPGGARLPTGWHLNLEPHGLPVPVHYDDAAAFQRWCRTVTPVFRNGVINLNGLQPLVKAEIKWGLHAHAQVRNRTHWDAPSLQRLANHCRERRAASLFDLSAEGFDGLTLGPKVNSVVRMISLEIIGGLRCIYYSPDDTRDAGFIETDHFGRRFPNAQSHYDLTGITQRWLRDLLWDHLADMLRSPGCPRSRGPFDATRRACVELGAFLATDAPQGGHDPTVLGAEHVQRFVADLRHRARHGLRSLGLFRTDGQPSTVTDVTCRLVLNYAHRTFHAALKSGSAERVGLDRAFVTALPLAGKHIQRTRSPFSDEVARALADETNLRRLAETYDPGDRGLRDIWEAIVATGRRCNEVLTLRLDCIGRYQGLPMLWHDQTKVGNYDQGIRIPEPLYQRLDERRRKTLTRFEHRHGRLPDDRERAAAALFPSDVRNPQETSSVSYRFFCGHFKSWVQELDLGSAVAHQARHTLATNLLRAGASLAHIRRYLGQVSDRMAEHYTTIAHSDLEDVLHAVWVAGPGAPNPGELLASTTTPLSREQALALALDVSRRSTPADGGFCTFQPVVDGGACPWKLDCENCDKFVLSGADLLYWRRKQEQWRSIAERAPDDATADYLHQVFEPTARAIEGLEKALAGLGLLEEALAMDLRRPQDYFHRIWSTNFRAADLAAAADTPAPPEDALP